MKNLFLPIIVISFVVASCKKKDATNNLISVDSANPQTTYSDTLPSTSKISTDSTSGRDSINTKNHIGGRKTSNNNSGSVSGNINAAVSDSARPARLD